MKITMLGTGHAMVYNCFNTCFVIEDQGQYMLVDGGGGFELLNRLKKADIDLFQIKDIFVSHKHLDHITGIFWILRVVLQGAARGRKTEPVRIYAHEEVIHILYVMAEELLGEACAAQIGKALELIEVKDGEHRNVIGHDVVFFDIHAKKVKQYGFSFAYDDQRLVFLGDEPYDNACRKYVQNCDWCMHEAFCMDAESEIYHPRRISHSTVKSACETAEELGVKNLILYHTEDRHMQERKELYTAEGRKYYKGNLQVPDDLETIVLQKV